jgi:hypothetical protein
MTKRAVVHVSMELIHHLLDLPPHVEVLHATIGNYGLTLDVVITAPDMADTDVAIGCTPPSARTTYVRENGVGRLESLEYPRQRDS